MSERGRRESAMPEAISKVDSGNIESLAVETYVVPKSMPTT
jgi:hypothetical protein